MHNAIWRTAMIVSQRHDPVVDIDHLNAQRLTGHAARLAALGYTVTLRKHPV